MIFTLGVMVLEVCSESRSRCANVVVEEHTNDDVRSYHENTSMTRTVDGTTMTTSVDRAIIHIGIDI